MTPREEIAHLNMLIVQLQTQVNNLQTHVEDLTQQIALQDLQTEQVKGEVTALKQEQKV